MSYIFLYLFSEGKAIITLWLSNFYIFGVLKKLAIGLKKDSSKTICNVHGSFEMKLDFEFKPNLT